MVTPFEVYLVMQLDQINVAAAAFGILAGAGGCASAIICTTSARDQWPWDKEPLEDRISRFDGYSRLSRRVAFAGAASLLVAVLLPSTKTAAAMILLPALTSKEVTEPLSREAGELYELAKSALRNAANKPAPKPEPDK